MSSVTVEIWKTINFWEIKGRPATQYWDGSQWVGMPGDWNPGPGRNYRLEIVWGPKMRVTDVENWLENPTLRVVFAGWKIGNKFKYQDSMQFYNDSAYTQPTATPYRGSIDYPNTIFQPYFADVVGYAYFRVKVVRDRAWKMSYDIGIYGSVFQGIWQRVIAR